MNNSYDIVDFHSHILPGADHGSSDVETSLFQLNEAKNCGIERIIATPHFYPTAHSVESFLERRNAAYRSLAESASNDIPHIVLGAEVLVCDNIEELPNLNQLFIQGTNTLLLELPFSIFSDSFCDSVDILISQGVDVVIAHADRYASENVEKLIDVGAHIQINSGALLPLFKRRVIYDWLERGVVVALGSDIHGKDKTAYPGFVKAISRIEQYLAPIKEYSGAVFSKASSFRIN